MTAAKLGQDIASCIAKQQTDLLAIYRAYDLIISTKRWLISLTLPSVVNQRASDAA